MTGPATGGAPDVDVRVVAGTARVDDLDDFLADVNAVRETTGAVVQVFDARYVVTRPPLVRAVELAERAAARGEAVARDRAVEVLLYAAGRRQIDRALAMGVDEGEGPAAAVVYAPAAEEGGRGDDAREASVGQAVDRVRDLLTDAALVDPGEDVPGTDRATVREFFDVSDAELAAVDGTLADVVLERVALLDVEK